SAEAGHFSKANPASPRTSASQMQVPPDPRRWQTQVDVKGAELAVTGGDFVEPHLVNNLFERVYLMRHQRYAPLPVVDARRARDKLRNPPGKFAPHTRMSTHQLFTRSKIELIPVVRAIASFAHRIKRHHL